MARRVTLEEEQSADGSRGAWAYIDDRGTLFIQGQSLSRSADFFEYEWAFTIPASHVPAVAEALGGQPGDDVLAVLQERYREPRIDLSRRLTDAGIEFDFWSRVGD